VLIDVDCTVHVNPSTAKKLTSGQMPAACVDGTTNCALCLAALSVALVVIHIPAEPAAVY
jgi:hypothetical protein